jgi:hypothetical protein
VLVFDGQPLPSKRHEDKARSERRKLGRKLANELLLAGDRQGAEKAYQKCISVTSVGSCDWSIR